MAAANKFAAMLHKNTHKISLVLIYAVLEWTLILLLLINSLFSYLITKFAKHFGLKPPCPWCSRLDKFFDPSKPDTSYRDLICEAHSAEISRLSYCSRHGKLGESHEMCEECSPSTEADRNANSGRSGGSFDFFSWVEEMGKISNDGKRKERVHENGERSSRCSCCEVSLNSKMYTPYWLFKPSWEVVDYIKKENPVEEVPDPPRKSIYLKNHFKNALEIIEDDEDEEEEEEEEEDEEEDDEEEEEDEESDEMLGEDELRPDVDECVQVNDAEECSKSHIGHRCEKGEIDGDGILDNVVKNEKSELLEEEDPTLLVKARNSFRSSRSVMTQLCSPDNVSLEMLPAHLEKWSDHDDHFLVTIESLDSMGSEKHSSPEHKKLKNEDNEGSKPAGKVPKLVESIDDLSIVLEIETDECSAKHQSESRSTELEHNADDSEGESFCLEVEDQVDRAEEAQSMPANDDASDVANEVITERSNEPSECEENGIEAFLAKAETLQGMEISDHKLIDQLHVQDLQIPSLQTLEDHASLNCSDAKTYTNYGLLWTENRQEVVKAGKVIVEETSIPAEIIKHGMNLHSSISLKLDKVEEDTTLEISNMELDLIDLPKKFLPLERKESVAEEFKFQSAATADIVGREKNHDIEQLKAALVAERKVLNVLYAELAAERSAAATAANQTMVMITKLQEEKASMQMEALQYQRMMEEQSEYDQEALKLLNELMVKREKEKQELEKELEIYRKRVYLYEEKERRVLRRRSTNEKSTTPSTSCNSEDGDGANDRQESVKEAATPGDTIQNLDHIGLESSRQLSTLDESLVDFEEERMAILEQLKTLEEKLFALDDDEDEGGFFEDLHRIESFSAETNGGFGENNEYHSAEANGFSNGHCKSVVGENGHAKRNIDDNPKKLLPLFDAIGMESEDEILPKEEQKISVSLTKQSSMSSQCTSYNKKIAVEEEIDHVYQRVQALEADREFLRHCVISLKKGDKGMDLLEEILQHLRDLKNVEVRAKNTCDALLL